MKCTTRVTSPEFIYWKGYEAAIWKEEPFYIFRKIRGNITVPIRWRGWGEQGVVMEIQKWPL